MDRFYKTKVFGSSVDLGVFSLIYRFDQIYRWFMLTRLVDNLYVDSRQWFQLPKILMDHICNTYGIPQSFGACLELFKGKKIFKKKIEGVFKQLSQRALWIAKSWNCYKTQNLSFIIKALFSGRLNEHTEKSVQLKIISLKLKFIQ